MPLALAHLHMVGLMAVPCPTHMPQSLLSELGVPPTTYPSAKPQRAIYCSRTLNLRSIVAVGYDVCGGVGGWCECVCVCVVGGGGGGGGRGGTASFAGFTHPPTHRWTTRS